jgi:hypothetical protein
MDIDKVKASVEGIEDPALTQYVSPPKVEEEVDVSFLVDKDPPNFTPPLIKGNRHENAAGKKLCGMCKSKVAVKGDWRCSRFQKVPSHNIYGVLHTRGIPVYPCPAPNGDCAGFEPKPSKPRPPQSKKKPLRIPPGVTFIYIGRPRGDAREHHGVVTVAMISPSPGILHLGFSFCSPSDPWCKITGRDLTLARLINPIKVSYLYSPRQTALEVAKAVMAHDFELLRVRLSTPFLAKIPSWTKKLAAKIEQKKENLKRVQWLISRGQTMRVSPPLPPPAGSFFDLRKKVDEKYPRGGGEITMTPIHIMIGMFNDILNLPSQAPHE